MIPGYSGGGGSGRDQWSPRSNKASISRNKRKVVVSKRHSIGKGKPTVQARPKPGTFVVTPRRKVGLPDVQEGGVDAATQRGNINVVVRVRPPNQRETLPSTSLVVQAVDSNMVVFDPIIDSNDFYFHGVKQQARDYGKKRNKDMKFIFDNVFGPESTNREIFDQTIKPTIDTIIAGFNCSVFAYGATGSGKTHTMVGGVETEYGLTYLTVMELYKHLQDLNDEFESDIRISYLEVYNEQVKDLLEPSEAVLKLVETDKGVTIFNLSAHKPVDADHILNLLKVGNSRRSQHPTDHNHESSRSHAVFQVMVSLRRRYRTLTNDYRAAKLVMVDLAGSERGAATGFEGARFREGASINKSLLALGNCINALAEGKKHVPYRDSKLTRILKDALGGNCKTVMIANVSPSSLSYEDSFNTLKYADRAKKIKFNVKKNAITYSARAAQYAKVVEEMSAKIKLLQGIVDDYQKHCHCKISKSDMATDLEGNLVLSTAVSTREASTNTPFDYCDTGFMQSNNPSVRNETFTFRSNNTNPGYMNLEATNRHEAKPHSVATVIMKSKPYQKFSALLDQKIELISRSNNLLTQLRDVDWKLKQKQARIDGAQTLATNEAFVIKGMERMTKHRDALLVKKNDYQRKLGDVERDLTVVKERLLAAEKEFGGNQVDEGVLISRQDLLLLKKLQAEKSLQADFQSRLQPSFDGIFGEMVKTEEMLYRSIKQLKPRHLLTKHLGHTTNENEQEYQNLLSDFYCSRIHFANNNNDTTVALSPYCDNLNNASPAAADNDHEADVTSSTD